MAANEEELVGLMVEQSEDEARDNPEAQKKGGRYVAPAFPGGPRSKVRFGAKASGLHDDRLSTKAAPGPKGPSAAELIEEARRRRRQRAEEERSR